VYFRESHRLAKRRKSNFGGELKWQEEEEVKKK